MANKKKVKTVKKALETPIHCAHSSVVDIDSLVPHPLNPNNHPDKQIKYLAKIMAHQGWRHPVTVSKRSGFIVAGHGRVLAARKNGWTKVPIDQQEFFNEADEYAHLIADNKIAELAEHDNEKMLNDLEAFPDLDTDLLGIPNLLLDDADTSVKEVKDEDIEDEQKHLLIVEFDNEQELQEVYEELLERGLECRLMD